MIALRRLAPYLILIAIAAAVILVLAIRDDGAAAQEAGPAPSRVQNPVVAEPSP